MKEEIKAIFSVSAEKFLNGINQSIAHIKKLGQKSKEIAGNISDNFSKVKSNVTNNFSSILSNIKNKFSSFKSINASIINQFSNFKSDAGKLFGKLTGFGTPLAVIQFALKNIVNLGKAFAASLIEAKKNAAELAEKGITSLEDSNAYNSKRRSESSNFITRLQSLNSSGLLGVDDKLMITAESLVNQLNNRYQGLGLTINKTTNSIMGLETAQRKMLALDHNAAISGLQSEISIIDKAINSYKELYEEHSAYSYRVKHGESDMVADSEKIDQLTNKKIQKTQELQFLKNQNPLQDNMLKEYDKLAAEKAKTTERIKQLEIKAQDNEKKLIQDKIDAENQIYSKTLQRLSEERKTASNKVASFGFSSAGPLNPLSFTGKDLRGVRNQNKLDSSIADKMAKLNSGERVHFTYKEKKRIEEEQAAQKELADVDAREAAAKQAHEDNIKELQTQAAESLKSSADEMSSITEELQSAKDSLTGITEQMNNLLSSYNSIADSTKVDTKSPTPIPTPMSVESDVDLVHIKEQIESKPEYSLESKAAMMSGGGFDANMLTPMVNSLNNIEKNCLFVRPGN